MANIGKTITIDGDVTGDENLVIDGTVRGRIEVANHELTIGPNGTAEGEVFAKEITVLGRVHGDLQATERIRIEADGHVEGDIEAPRLFVEEGAVVNGRMSTTRPAQTAAAASPSSSVRVQRPQPVAKLDQPKAAATPKVTAKAKS